LDEEKVTESRNWYSNFPFQCPLTHTVNTPLAIDISPEPNDYITVFEYSETQEVHGWKSGIRLVKNWAIKIKALKFAKLLENSHDRQTYTTTVTTLLVWDSKPVDSKTDVIGLTVDPECEIIETIIYDAAKIVNAFDI
jgi:hypothetical protein